MVLIWLGNIVYIETVWQCMFLSCVLHDTATTELGHGHCCCLGSRQCRRWRHSYSTHSAWYSEGTNDPLFVFIFLLNVFEMLQDNTSGCQMPFKQKYYKLSQNVFSSLCLYTLCSWSQRTDITDYALHALSQSRVRRVYMVGRRGPLQAAFTTAELRDLTKLPGCRSVFNPSDFAGFQNHINGIFVRIMN